MRNKMPKAGMLAGVLAVFATGAVAYPHYRAVLAAMRLYYLREMLAALLLFSMGFTILAVVISILLLIDRGLYRALAWTGPYTAHAAQRLHWGWVQVEHFGRKQFHRSEQPAER